MIITAPVIILHYITGHIYIAPWSWIYTSSLAECGHIGRGPSPIGVHHRAPVPPLVGHREGAKGQGAHGRVQGGLDRGWGEGD